jgi:hypothetical protein
MVFTLHLDCPVKAPPDATMWTNEGTSHEYRHRTVSRTLMESHFDGLCRTATLIAPGTNYSLAALGGKNYRRVAVRRPISGASLCMREKKRVA